MYQMFCHEMPIAVQCIALTFVFHRGVGALCIYENISALMYTVLRLYTRKR